ARVQEGEKASRRRGAYRRLGGAGAMTDLFTPLSLGDLALPNRIVMAPLTRSRATLERVPTPMMAEHYVQRAAAGLIIAEATNVVPQSIAWDCGTTLVASAMIR